MTPNTGSGSVEPGKWLVPVSTALVLYEKRSKGGRPSYLSDAYSELIDEMMIELMNGRSLNNICRDEHMPARSTVMHWLAKADAALARDDKSEKIQPYIQFLDRFTRARGRQPEALLDDCIDIADDGSNDWMEREDRKGNTYPAVDHEHINRSRLRIDTRMKLAEKLSPQKYGPKPLIEVNDNSVTNTQNNFAQVVVQRAEELTRPLPSEALVQGKKAVA